MKADQERVSKLLTDTVTLLCKNGLIYTQEIKVQGLLGITLDKNDVFIVHINETIGGVPGAKDPSDGATTPRKKSSLQASPNFVDLTRMSDTPLIPGLNAMSQGGGGPSIMWRRGARKQAALYRPHGRPRWRP